MVLVRGSIGWSESEPQVKGSGVDKHAGNKVQFRVAIFPAGGDKVGIVYTDYDNDAPDGTMKELHGIIESIKVAKKEK